MKKEFKVKKVEGGMSFECINMDLMDIICSLKICLHNTQRMLNMPLDSYKLLINFIMDTELKGE